MSSALDASPPPVGARLDWDYVPPRVHAVVEDWLGSRVVASSSHRTGFSPGAAATLWTANGRRVFAKAAGPLPNPQAPASHRQEARVAAALPETTPAPRLLWAHDEGEGGWVALLFEHFDGGNPDTPWRAGDLDRVVDALVAMSAALTPSPLLPGVVGQATEWPLVTTPWWGRAGPEALAGLDPWSSRHLDRLARLAAAAPDAIAGETLLHLDLRADNLLLTPDRVLVVDWPHARVGAAWADAVFLAPSVAMQGGPDPEELIARFPAARPADLAAVVAAMAGFFTTEALRPAPPGLPTLRAFQAAQGEASRSWLAGLTGWT